MPDVAHLYRTVQDQRTGRILNGVTVALCEPGSQTPISDSLFSDEMLSRPLANPFIAADGVIDVYLTGPRNVAIKTTYGSASVLADNIPILPHAEYLLATPTPVTILNGPGSGTVLVGVDASTAQFAAPSGLFIPITATVRGWCYSGAYALLSVERDADGAALNAEIEWPDGTPGTFVADVVSLDFPGKVDAFTMTYGDPVIYTLIQAEVTRDPVNGSVTAQPSVIVNE